MSTTISAPPQDATSFVRAIADLAPRFRERSPETEANASVPRASMDELIEAGMARMLVPRARGGLELGLRALVDATAAAARGCPATGWCAGQMAFAGYVVAEFPEEAQRTVWADDPDAVLASTVIGFSTTPVPGGYRLTGRGAWASGVKHATWLYLGAPIAQPQGPPEMRFFLLPMHQARFEETWDTVAMRGTGSNTVVVDDVFIPEAFTLRMSDIREGAGPGASVNTGNTYQLPWVAAAPVIYVATILGATQSAYEDVVETLKGKRAPNGTRAAESDDLQLKVALASARIDAAEMLLHARADHADSGQGYTLASRARHLRDCNFAVVLLVEAMDALLAISGTSGFEDDSFVQRAWRDVHLAAAHQTLNKRLVVTRYGKLELGVDEPVKPLFY